MSDTPLPKPFPEARPPHLPDVLTRQSPWVLAFLAIAVLQVWRAWTSITGLGAENAGSALGLAISSIQTIIPPLFGAALFWRHPKARATMPPLVFGLALFAFGELLGAFEQPIREVLLAIAPPAAEGTVFDTPAVVAFGVFTSLLSIFAVLYTAAGLAATRRGRSAAERPLTVWLVALVIVSFVLYIAGILPILQNEATPDIAIRVVLGAVLSVLGSLAWAYFVSVTVGGWLAGEAPRRAWIAAAIATAVLFTTPLVVGASLVLGTDALVLASTVALYTSMAAWLLLLAAFLLGLPAPPGDEPAEATVDPPAATRLGSAAG